jgi:hypothetical protein
MRESSCEKHNTEEAMKQHKSHAHLIENIELMVSDSKLLAAASLSEIVH